MLAQITIYEPFIRTVNAVVRLHQQPQEFCATISALYQCVKKCSQCVVIKFLYKTFASLPRKKPNVVIVFWMLFHGNMTTAALRRADFTQFLAVTLEKSTCHGKTSELCWICSPNHELNHQLLGRAINCNVTGGLCARCHHK